MTEETEISPMQLTRLSRASLLTAWQLQEARKLAEQQLGFGIVTEDQVVAIAQIIATNLHSEIVRNK